MNIPSNPTLTFCSQYSPAISIVETLFSHQLMMTGLISPSPQPSSQCIPCAAIKLNCTLCLKSQHFKYRRNNSTHYSLILSIYILRDVKSNVKATARTRECILNSHQGCSHVLQFLVDCCMVDPFFKFYYFLMQMYMLFRVIYMKPI